MLVAINVFKLWRKKIGKRRKKREKMSEIKMELTILIRSTGAGVFVLENNSVHIIIFNPIQKKTVTRVSKE